ncbi:MAG: glycoside hydrolase family 16 protein, partial [Paludibacteraceae bacterium]|nr:glycoside hydrolase family 16 protein [Paludibacteraceae bacterium]
MKNLRISIFLLFLVTQLNVFAAYQLVWEESFDCESLNTTLWNYETGVGANCDGSGNWERQEYTNSTDNIYMENGNLVLKAIYNDHVSQPCNYRTYWTSGRINTKDRFSVKYGKIEARIKLPRNGLGVFPAFWMLGANYDAVGWPSCGEIDIMEQMGVNYSQGGKITPTTLHWNAGGHADYGGSLNIYDRFGTMPADDYFIYGVEWTPDNIRGYVCRGDGSDWTEVMNRDGGSGYGCPDAMKQEFYIILNLAMGGTPVGEFPDNAGDVPFNPTMYIDWIRIYQDKAAYPASSFTDYSGDCGDTPTYPSVSDKDYILLCRESELPCTDEYTDLRYNTGATQFNLWGNMDGANGVTPAEGAESLAFVTNANAVAQNWYGYGIHSGTMYDYSALTDYTLHLKYYTNTAGA